MCVYGVLNFDRQPAAQIRPSDKCQNRVPTAKLVSKFVSVLFFVSFDFAMSSSALASFVVIAFGVGLITSQAHEELRTHSKAFSAVHRGRSVYLTIKFHFSTISTLLFAVSFGSSVFVYPAHVHRSAFLRLR